jgi:integrase
MTNKRCDKDFHLKFTTGNCLVGGLSYPHVPLLLDPNNQVIWIASDWLRYLIVVRCKAPSSVRQFAYHLLNWWRHLRRLKISWDKVDDSTMIKWRDGYFPGIEDATVNGYISTVFRMYLWAEHNGYVKGMIGEPDLRNDVHPPLSLDVLVDRRGTRRFASPLLKRTLAKPVLPTPTHEEITTIHAVLANGNGDNLDLMVRNALILTWAEASGTRRMEGLSLTRSQIPPWDEILALEETGDKKEISIIGKRRKRRSLWVGADLLTQTREYIEEERQRVVNRMRKRYGSNYKNPEAVFLSSKTGCKLQEDTASQIFAVAFRKAGVKGSLHRVRARFLTTLIENAIEREVETLGAIPDATSVLLPVAELAGHTNVETLAPYFAHGKKRLLRQSRAEQTAAKEERAVAAERRMNVNLVKLRATQLALDLVDAVASGNKTRMTNTLTQFCETYQIPSPRRLSMDRMIVCEELSESAP